MDFGFGERYIKLSFCPNQVPERLNFQYKMQKPTFLRTKPRLWGLSIWRKLQARLELNQRLVVSLTHLPDFYAATGRLASHSIPKGPFSHRSPKNTL
jgi:hypothetical protein